MTTLCHTNFTEMFFCASNVYVGVRKCLHSMMTLEVFELKSNAILEKLAANV